MDLSQFKITAKEIKALQSIQLKCYSQSVAMGWHDKPREDGTMIALCHSELSEALEGLRKGLLDDHLPDREQAEVELADCVIRILDLAGRKQYDIASAVAEKLAYNAQREDHQPQNRIKQGGKSF